MVRLIDDLLDVSRITSGKIQLQREPTPLNSLAEQRHRCESRRHCREADPVDVDVPEALVRAGCRPDTVRPGRFQSAAQRHEVHRVRRLDSRRRRTCSDGETDRASGAARSPCADSGIGIPAEFLPRVFDLFTQGDRGSSQPGLGIGLALARRLVEMHAARSRCGARDPGGQRVHHPAAALDAGPELSCRGGDRSAAMLIAA